MVEASTGAMGEKKVRVQEHLMAQDAATVDPTKLTALTPEVVSFPGRTLTSAAGAQGRGLDGVRRCRARGRARRETCDLVGEGPCHYG